MDRYVDMYLPSFAALVWARFGEIVHFRPPIEDMLEGIRETERNSKYIPFNNESGCCWPSSQGNIIRQLLHATD